MQLFCLSDWLFFACVCVWGGGGGLFGEGGGYLSIFGYSELSVKMDLAPIQTTCVPLDMSFLLLVFSQSAFAFYYTALPHKAIHYPSNDM